MTSKYSKRYDDSDEKKAEREVRVEMNIYECSERGIKGAIVLDGDKFLESRKLIDAGFQEVFVFEAKPESWEAKSKALKRLNSVYQRKIHLQPLGDAFDSCALHRISIKYRGKGILLDLDSCNNGVTIVRTLPRLLRRFYLCTEVVLNVNWSSRTNQKGVKMEDSFDEISDIVDGSLLEVENSSDYKYRNNRSVMVSQRFVLVNY